ncbi:hypothetical protein EHQ12_16175 [Leptospira gomenensis]|uniref:Lipoprotein n=1 Tax=Leptospira gomenensis TaxID=2484974 RepID=A0A5F1YF79_9LEPT|nr:hypothetical protein [Leptospira gomenensis]TGK34924.1 hypothetical protein EHQ12_16175 [Leptospira gomenensis]TGK38435.1 hypothetical protein EHQ17_01990 [Leptospira gomenensis]TGK44229.1 hypothetical protein EHQ07_12270 [Leptospira gomenensis]TGK67497.1 hypothetical protein EHQ13_01965 [Leptospira gomenensis]
MRLYLIAAFILIVFLMISCAGYVYEPFRPLAVTTSQNTYVRFKFENKRNDSEKAILQDKDRIAKFFTYSFRVSIWDHQELFTKVKDFRTINPYFEYWQRYYNQTRMLRYGIHSLSFVENCEYKMPIPVGINKYKFDFSANDPRRLAKIVKTLNVPPNHSIRIIFDIDGPPQVGDEVESDEGTYFKSHQIPISLEIIPNPEPDIDKPCEIPEPK